MIFKDLRVFLLLGVCSVVISRRPNIVFILADDYGWNDVGYHNENVYTPTLDKLAASGVKLDNYYVQPICTPSRSQLLSGRYQIHTGLQHGLIWAQQPNGLPLELPTIADVVKKAGYSTHMVGKWHLGFFKQDYTPLSRGFDTFYGYLTGSEDYYTHTRCISIACGLDLRDNLNPDWNQKGVYSANLFTEKAKEVIVNHTKQKDDKPLFLYLPYQSVHMPLQVPARYLQRYRHIRDTNRRKYLAMVTCMDEAVANVTQQLKDSGLWQDTVLIFSADNGGQVIAGGNNWPLRGWKGSLWDGGMRAVGFVTAGDNIKLENRGTILNDLLHITDWFPTIANLSGADIQGIQLDGYNIWDTISHGNSAIRKEILHNIDPMYPLKGSPKYNVSFSTTVRAALRVGQWKLITGDPGDSRWIPEPTEDVKSEFSPELLDDTFVNEMLEFKIDKLRMAADKSPQNLWLFNIDQDPNEENDVSSKHPGVVLDLLQRLSEYNATAVPVRYPKFDEEGCDPRKHGGVWSPWRD